MRMTYRDTALAVLAALIWGATFPVSAIALEDTPPIFFTFLRFLCAAAFVFVVPRPRIAWSKLVTLGLLLGAGQYGLMFIAMSHGMPAGMAAVLVHTQAIVTVLIAVLFLDERPTPRTRLTMVLTSAGLACLFFDQAQGGAVIAFLLMILAAFSAALGNIIIKSAGRVEMISVAVWMSLAPLIPLALLSGYLEVGTSVVELVQTVTPETWAAVAYSAILSTVAAYAIWGRLLVRYTTGQVAPFFLFVPVFGLGLSALILKEEFSALQLSGSALILLGLLISVVENARDV